MLQDGEDAEAQIRSPLYFLSAGAILYMMEPTGEWHCTPVYTCKLSTAAAPRSAEWSSYFEPVK